MIYNLWKIYRSGYLASSISLFMSGKDIWILNAKIVNMTERKTNKKNWKIFRKMEIITMELFK
jgi:hypothetical protein